MPPPPRIEIHHDFAVLERRLSALLRGLKEEHGPLAPAAVVVPTARLRAHLQERLGAAHGTLLHVHFFHHDSLAAAAAVAAGRTLPRPLGDAAREAMLADLLARSGGPLARYAQALPGSVASILATLDDLREAGIDPRAAGRVAGLSEETALLLEAYAGYCGALERLRAAGYDDRAGRIAGSLSCVPAFARRFRLWIHYGAYELTGVNLDLMRAVERGEAPVVYLAPGSATAPAFAYARDFWSEAFGVAPSTLVEDPPVDAREGRLLAPALPLLYDEDAAGPERRDAEAAFYNALGATGEMEEAFLRIVRQRDEAEAPPLHRTAIVARGLGPYAPLLAGLARDHGVPVATSATLPLRTRAFPLAAVRLLRAVLLDVPADALFDLLRSGRLVRPRASRGDIDRWERLARDHGVRGGGRLFTRHLPAWLEPGGGADFEAARRLAELVAALDREAASLKRSRDWAAFAAAAADLLRACLGGAGAQEAEAAPADGAGAFLDALADLAPLAVAGVRFESPGAALARLEEAIGALASPGVAFAADGSERDRDEGGVRVLDVMQARGCAFDTVYLLGMNAALFPRPARPDPFLPDADRRRLRETLRRPLPIKEDGLQEEHLLLALTLGSARRRVVVAWQRGDDDGRPRSASLALREIARITRGSPDLDRLAGGVQRRSGDPDGRVREALHAHGLLSRSEALLGAAFAAASPSALHRALPDLDPLVAPPDAATLSAGLDFLRAIERSDDHRFDSLVGPPSASATPAPPSPWWSPSRLEMLGGCAQQLFFRHVLGIEEWGDAAAAHAIDASEIGQAVHATLAAVYTQAGASSVADASGRAALVRASWEQATAAIAARLQRQSPGLWEIVGGAWRDSLVRFVEADLPPLLAEGAAIACETPIETPLTIPACPAPVLVRGRFDRLVRRGGALRVGDYKTGGNPEGHVDLNDILKGRRLQMPLYALMAEAEAAALLASADTAAGGGAPEVEVEVLAVGPGFDPGPASRATLDRRVLGEHRAAVLETLGVLLRLADAGLYPLNETGGRCGWCRYRRACRRAHDATLERLAGHADLRDYALLRRKNRSNPLLEDVADRSPEAGA